MIDRIPKIVGKILDIEKNRDSRTSFFYRKSIYREPRPGYHLGRPTDPDPGHHLAVPPTLTQEARRAARIGAARPTNPDPGGPWGRPPNRHRPKRSVGLPAQPTPAQEVNWAAHPTDPDLGGELGCPPHRPRPTRSVGLPAQPSLRRGGAEGLS